MTTSDDDDDLFNILFLCFLSMIVRISRREFHEKNAYPFRPRLYTKTISNIFRRHRAISPFFSSFFFLSSLGFLFVFLSQFYKINRHSFNRKYRDYRLVETLRKEKHFNMNTVMRAPKAGFAHDTWEKVRGENVYDWTDALIETAISLRFLFFKWLDPIEIRCRPSSSSLGMGQWNDWWTIRY